MWSCRSGLPCLPLTTNTVWGTSAVCLLSHAWLSAISSSCACLKDSWAHLDPSKVMAVVWDSYDRWVTLLNATLIWESSGSLSDMGKQSCDLRYFLRLCACVHVCAHMCVLVLKHAWTCSCRTQRTKQNTFSSCHLILFLLWDSVSQQTQSSSVWQDQLILKPQRFACLRYW